MKIRLILIFVAAALLCPVFAEAQTQQGTITVTGTVVDERGEPLPGAFVLVPGTTNGTSTDANGKFSINVSAGGSLEVRFMGYETKKVSVPKERRNISVSLSPDKNLTLNEAVTIAYGSVRKQDLTGSVTNVKMADVKDAPVLSVDQTLQGRIAGTDIMTTSGEPGAATSIRIRGARSIIASNEPLIVVDGVMDAVSDLGDLNSADIESISVLKDASSTAIYGSRGSNGVIIVTTRQGSTGSKPRITFKAEAGISQLPKKLDLMNASEFAQYRNDIALFQSSNTDAVPGAAPSEYPYPDPLSYGQGTDWIGAIMRTAAYQNYNLSLSGGNKEASYYASLGYNDTEGIVKNSGQTRYTGRINLDRQLFKWMKVGYKGSYTYRSQDKLLANIGGTSTRSAMYLSTLPGSMSFHSGSAPDAPETMRLTLTEALRCSPRLPRATYSEEARRRRISEDSSQARILLGRRLTLSRLLSICGRQGRTPSTMTGLSASTDSIRTTTRPAATSTTSSTVEPRHRSSSLSTVTTMGSISSRTTIL